MPDSAHLAVERLLLAQRDLAQAAVDHELGPLLRDERLGAELVETPQIYFDSGENMRETARRLHLANRTVAYRLARIEALLGAPIGDAARRRLAVALLVRRLQQEALKCWDADRQPDGLADPRRRGPPSADPPGDRRDARPRRDPGRGPRGLRARGDPGRRRGVRKRRGRAGGDRGRRRDRPGREHRPGRDRIPVGILPCGAGNLYAAAVEVPRDLRAAIANLRTGEPAPYDVGAVRLEGAKGEVVADTSFVVACGTGLDARLIAATTRESKRRYGVAAYFLAASRLLGHLEPVPTRLEIDGRVTELESVVVLIANCGEAIPGQLRPRLPIRADDGLFHVFVLPRGGVFSGIRGAMELMLAEATGQSSSGAGIRLAGTRVRVEVSRLGQHRSTATPTARRPSRRRSGRAGSG